VRDFALNLGDQRAGPCITTMQRFTLTFSPGDFFYQKRHVILHPPYFSLLPSLKIKLKGCHFDTIEVIEAESQAVLNILTEHNFQDAFTKRQKSWERCIWVERDYLKSDGDQ
jgi:hypothetical protein